MTLSEIETILEQLAARHQNLDTVLLTTLLSSAGWEEKTIKEAIVLFTQRKPVTLSTRENAKTLVSVPVAPVQTPVTVFESVKIEEPLTFLKPDGSDEGVLPVFSNETVKRSESPKIEQKKVETEVHIIPKKSALKEHVKAVPEDIQQIKVPLEKVQSVSTSPQPEVVKMVPVALPVKVEVQLKEPESLIVHEDIPVRRVEQKNVEIPGNLPLLPFESSPHIWSFSKYKDMFHKESPHKEEVQLITVMPKEEKSSVTAPIKVLQEVAVSAPRVKDEEVTLEKAPMTKGDESLVFLAGMMLFAIILILGYMYSNGRL